MFLNDIKNFTVLTKKYITLEVIKRVKGNCQKLGKIWKICVKILFK